MTAWDDAREGEVVPLTVPTGAPEHIQTLEVVHTEPEGVPLALAAIVVAGGAGVMP